MPKTFRDARRPHGSELERLERRRFLSLTPLTPAETLVNSFITGSQVSPAAAMDADGDYVVVWQSGSGQDGDGSGIFAQRFDTAGAPQGIEFQVNDYTTGAQTLPAVAMGPDGEFVVAWTSDGQDGALTGIYAQRFDASGNPQGGEFRVNTYTTNRQTEADVAVDDAGNFVIAWQSLGQDTSGNGVYAQRYDAAGNPQGGEFQVNQAIFADQAKPSVAADTAGNFVVAWDSTNQDGSGTSVHARRYDAAGAALGGEFLVNIYTTGTQREPDVAMDADGDFVITWESSGQDGDDYGIAARRFDPTGAPVGDEFIVNTATAGNQGPPTVAMDDGGDFIITWPGPDANGLGIYAQAYFASGLTNDIELPVNTMTVSQQRAATIAMDADGDAVIAWQSFGPDGNGYGIYARRYRLLGGVLSSKFTFETAPHHVAFTFDDDYSAGLGTNDLLLENLTTMQTIPAAELALTYDPGTNTATFTYTGSSGSVPGTLPDGEYRATLLAAGVPDPGGSPLPADYVLEFFFLAADANHDRIVNLTDFNLLAANFGLSGQAFDSGDFTYDGRVNLADFNLLASRFGRILAPAANTTILTSFPRPWHIGPEDAAQ